MPAPDEEIRFIQANGIRFGFFDWGEGPLVLLFHGFPDTADTWREIGPAIARAGFRVVAPFLRGYAPTGIPGKDTDPCTSGEDVIALARAFGATTARLVGHDWGAEAVYAAVALQPALFERMVTIAIPPRAALPASPRLAWALRHFLTLSLPGAERRFAAKDFAMIETLWRRWSPTWRPTAEDLAPVKRAFATKGTLHAALGYYRAVTWRAPEFLRAPVTVSTLSISGADDPIMEPALFEAVRPHYRASYQVVTVRGGHFCHRESAQDVLGAVIPFLRA